MYQKLISDYIVHKLHSKFRIHTICIYKETTELKLPISHTAAYRSTTESNTNQNSSAIDQRRFVFKPQLQILHAAEVIFKIYNQGYSQALLSTTVLQKY